MWPAAARLSPVPAAPDRRVMLRATTDLPPVAMKLLLPLLVIGLAGCVAAPQTNDAVAADQVSCERETRTGSNLPTTRCRSAAQRETDRRQAESIGETIRPSSTLPPGRGS